MVFYIRRYSTDLCRILALWVIAAAGSFKNLEVNLSCFPRLADGYHQEKMLVALGELDSLRSRVQASRLPTLLTSSEQARMFC